MKFRKKPVVIDAIQWNGINLTEIKEFVGGSLNYEIHDAAWQVGKGRPRVRMTIHTLEGDHTCTEGDYIIKGVAGEFYPCKPDIFAQTYEHADAPTVDKVAVRCGHWTLFDEDSNVWSCSVCDEPYIICNDDTPRENNYNYCPNCGAKMGAVEGWTVNEIEKAIQEFIDNAFHESLKPDISIKSKALAIVALQEKLERERPEPLSIDQLRQMGGDSDPVWVQDLLIPSCSTWHFVRERDEEILLFDEFALARRIVGYNVTSGHNYGVTWLAYTHKPKQEGKT